MYTACYRDLAAVISNSPLLKYPITRVNTMAHQRVMEEVMRYHPILPVRFCTVAESKNGVSPEKRIEEHVLKKRYGEFQELLAVMADKVELGVKALWKNMVRIFQEIVEENEEIKRLKKEIAAMPPPQAHSKRIALGRKVKAALEAKKGKEERKILGPLKRLSVDCVKGRSVGDRMIANYAYLVETDREKEFDDQVAPIAERSNGRVELRYVGPVPPCNFVEIEVTWED